MSSLFDLEHIFGLAQRTKGVIGIGLRKREDTVKNSISEALDRGLPEVRVYDQSQVLCEDLQKGILCAAVRGTLPSDEMLESIRRVFGISKILRIALLVTADNRPFFMAPVGIDEGNTVGERSELLRRGIEFIRSMGVEPAISVLSKGRAEDYKRGEDIRRSLDEGEQLTKMAVDMGLVAKHNYILIEEAVRDADFVLAPDGVSGNIIFRSLYFLGKGDAIGAPAVNLDRVFVDTSRDKRSYTDGIALAAAICSTLKNGKRN